MTGRTEFRRRLDRLVERLPATPAAADESHIDVDAMSREELDAHLDLRSQQRAEDPEYARFYAKLSRMTEQELDECLHMFSLHPSKRGGWKL